MSLLLSWEDPQEKRMAPVSLTGEFHIQRSFSGPRSLGSQESDMTEHTNPAYNIDRKPMLFTVHQGILTKAKAFSDCLWKYSH